MAALRGWLTAVLAAAVFLSVAEKLVPDGTMRKAASLTGGLVLLLVLLQPLTGLDLEALELDVSDYAGAVEARRQELAAQSGAELAELIAERTAAYISDKAAALGIADCAVQVTTETGEDGVPYPYAAELSCPPSEPLRAYLEEELGIPQERQVFHGTQ